MPWTGTMTREGAETLAAARDAFLNEPRGFNMGWWGSDYDHEHMCGSACCIAGHYAKEKEWGTGWGSERVYKDLGLKKIPWGSVAAPPPESCEAYYDLQDLFIGWEGWDGFNAVLHGANCETVAGAQLAAAKVDDVLRKYGFADLAR